MAICSSLDIAIWDMTIPCTELIIIHEADYDISFVYAVEGEETVITFGEDEEKKLRKWDIITKKEVKCLTLKIELGCFIRGYNNKLLIGGEKEIEIIDMKSLVTEKRIRIKIDDQYDFVQLNHEILILYTQDSFYSVNLENSKSKIIKKFDDYNDIYQIIRASETSFITVKNNSLIKQWSFQ